jgi:hypothetical protein
MDPAQILEAAKSILLVDWPTTGVPRALVDAGFTVFGHSPSGYKQATIETDRPPHLGPRSVFPPKDAGETGFLVFRSLDAPPSSVDIVNVYRPAEEIAGIFASLVIPLGARALWLHPPVTSADGQRMAVQRGLHFVEGVDIVELAGRLRTSSQ